MLCEIEFTFNAFRQAQRAILLYPELVEGSYEHLLQQAFFELLGLF